VDDGLLKPNLAKYSSRVIYSSSYSFYYYYSSSSYFSFVSNTVSYPEASLTSSLYVPQFLYPAPPFLS